MPYTIDEIKSIAVPIAKSYGVESISLFGSYASRNPTPKSDIDFIIKKGDLTGIQYFSLLTDLENAFGCRIDLITTGFSNREFLNRIEKDEILLYER